MSDLPFRRRKRPGWIRPSEGPVDAKRLKGLDEFTPPPFLGRMDRVRRRRERLFHATLAITLVAGAAIGLFVI